MLLVTHATFAATVCSPVSWDVLSTYALLLYLSLVALVQPMDNFCGEAAREASETSAAAAGMMSSISSQTNMFKAVAYMLAFGYVMQHIPVDASMCKHQFLLLLACLDALLLYGHLWDRVPSLQASLPCLACACATS